MSITPSSRTLWPKELTYLLFSLQSYQLKLPLLSSLLHNFCLLRALFMTLLFFSVFSLRVFLDFTSLAKILCLGCHRHKIPQTGCFKQQNLFSHSSGGQAFYDQAAVRVDFYWGLSSWCRDSCFLSVSSSDFLLCAEGKRERMSVFQGSGCCPSLL